MRDRGFVAIVGMLAALAGLAIWQFHSLTSADLRTDRAMANGASALPQDAMPRPALAVTPR